MNLRYCIFYIFLISTSLVQLRNVMNTLISSIKDLHAKNVVLLGFVFFKRLFSLSIVEYITYFEMICSLKHFMVILYIVFQQNHQVLNLKGVPTNTLNLNRKGNTD